VKALATRVLQGGWSGARIESELDWFADGFDMTVYTGVPVAGPSLEASWGPDCRQLFEVVAVPAGPHRKAGVEPFEADAFKGALAAGSPVHPLLAFGKANRSAFGYLATRQAFIARTWRPSGPVQPLVLVDPDQARPDVAAAYYASGFGIVYLPGQIRTNRGSVRSNRDPWARPKPGSEDRFLNELWRRRERKGWWLAEVPLGTRRADAVVLAASEPAQSAEGEHLGDFSASVASGAEVEILEAKKELNVGVIGQLLAASLLFTTSYPGHGRIALTAVVSKASDEPLEWFCNRVGIKVEVVPVSR
jgi:hypothetical protein